MVAVQSEERDTHEEEVHTPTLDRDVGGDVLNHICNSVLVVKARTKLLNFLSNSKVCIGYSFL